MTAGSAGTVDNTPYFFFCPFWNHLLLEEGNQTDLNYIKYYVKGLKGAEELLSNLGLCESSLQMRKRKLKMPKGLQLRK